MPDIPRRPDILQLEGIVRGAVHDPELRAQGFGSVVRDVWGRITRGYIEGTITDPVGLRDVNALVSLASEQYRAEQRLQDAIDTYQRTGFDQGLTADMRARDIDTRPSAGFNYPASDRIRFQITTSIDGEPVTRWVTVQPGIEGPQSVQHLLQMAEDAGRGFAEDYGEVFEGLGDQFSVTYV